MISHAPLTIKLAREEALSVSLRDIAKGGARKCTKNSPIHTHAPLRSGQTPLLHPIPFFLMPYLCCCPYMRWFFFLYLFP